MTGDAASIYQAHLDAVSEALWARDYDRLLEHIHFPSFVETDDEVLRIDTPESYLPSVKSFRRKLDQHNATAYHRICLEAVFATDDPTRIEGMHKTYALSGATPVMTPYLSQMTLVHMDGKWLGAGIRAATDNARWHIIHNPKTPARRPDLAKGERK